MGRRKTISDDEILRIAAGAFRSRGHTVSGREIARLAGVSEAVLYQRFRTKDALFFAAMAPAEPDLAKIFGPRGSEGDARLWIRRTVERIAAYFEGFIPLAIPVLLHPGRRKGADREDGPELTKLEMELAARLRSLERRGAIAKVPHVATTRLLTSLAHDFALHNAFLSHRPRLDRRALGACVEAAWRGIAPKPKRKAERVRLAGERSGSSGRI